MDTDDTLIYEGIIIKGLSKDYSRKGNKDFLQKK